MTIRTLLLLMSLASAASAEWTVVLDDDFTTIDAETWIVAGQGGAVASDGEAVIRSGSAAGGGTWISSVESYDLSVCDYRLTVWYRQESATAPADNHFVGFFDDTGRDYAMGVLLDHCLESDLNAHIQVATDDGSVVRTAYQLAQSGFQTTHEYQIEFIAGTATFSVDGEARWITGCDVPARPYRIRLDKMSPGADTFLHVDRVVLEIDADCAVGVAGSDITTPTTSIAHPNPFRTGTTLLIPAGLEGSIAVAVVDVQGRLIREWSNSMTGGRLLIEWDGRSAEGAPVPAGVYLMRADDGTQVYSERLVKLD